MQAERAERRSVMRDGVSGGTCSPLPPAPHHLAFIGDSLTCGYGIDAASPEDAFSIATEHAAKSYAAQTAKLLHADAHILSYSGFGVYSGFPEESCKNETDLLPLVYSTAAGCARRTTRTSTCRA